MIGKEVIELRVLRGYVDGGAERDQSIAALARRREPRTQGRGQLIISMTSEYLIE
jgi:hypothetical protein